MRSPHGIIRRVRMARVAQCRAEKPRLRQLLLAGRGLPCPANEADNDMLSQRRSSALMRSRLTEA